MIDSNQQHASMAVTNDANLTPTDLVVDETTGRLLIHIINESATTEPRDIGIDANQAYVALAEKDDSSGVAPLLTTSDGYVYVDVSVE